MHLVGFCLFLSACSSVDSVRIFDQQQAEYLIHQNRTSQPTQQRIKISLPKKSEWKKIDLSFGVLGAPVMLVPQNETRTNWSQSIRSNISPLIHSHHVTTIQFVQNKLFAAKQDCQKIEIIHLQQIAESVIYRINKMNCYEDKNQLQIGKAFKGRDAIYLVYYSAIDGKVNREQIHQLSQVIETARLVSNPKY